MFLYSLQQESQSWSMPKKFNYQQEITISFCIFAREKKFFLKWHNIHTMKIANH
jgi:hypothetical protein